MRSSEKRERVVRRTLADGSVKEYRYPAARPKGARVQPDSVGALILAYRMSPQWGALGASTKKNKGYYLRDLEKLSTMPARSVLRRTLLALRDAIAHERGPGAANVFMRVTATLFTWARDRGWIEHSPADRVEALTGGHLPAWTAEEADLAAAKLPMELRRVVILARYTGQRRGDLIKMTWHAYNGQRIMVAQEKGAKRRPRDPLWIPVHPVLKRHLDAWKQSARSTHILVSQKGTPWKANHLTHTMADELLKIGLRDELNVHGLRKLAAAELASAGCTTHEIAAITGHRSLAMVQLYTESADQRRLAEAAIVRLKTASGNVGKRPRK